MGVYILCIVLCRSCLFLKHHNWNKAVFATIYIKIVTKTMCMHIFAISLCYLYALNFKHYSWNSMFIYKIVIFFQKHCYRNWLYLKNCFNKSCVHMHASACINTIMLKHYINISWNVNICEYPNYKDLDTKKWNNTLRVSYPHKSHFLIIKLKLNKFETRGAREKLWWWYAQWKCKKRGARAVVQW